MLVARQCSCFLSSYRATIKEILAREGMFQKTITDSLNEANLIIQELQSQSALIEQIAQKCSLAFEKGNKLLLAGNGGSMCDAAHFAEELVGYFKSKRQALPAIVLSEPGYLTCVANDTGFDQVFARGVEALGKPGDLLIVFSTSGNSPNILAALVQAKQQGLTTVAFLGKTGGKALGLADHELILSRSSDSARIQEGHMCAGHIIIDLLEQTLFSKISVKAHA